MKLLLKNGTLINPAGKISGKKDILINENLIEKIADSIKADKETEVYDLAGKLVCPGFIDMHVHLREPGNEEKETIKTGSKAAAAGGFTSVACMANTYPVADDVSMIKHIKEVAARNAQVNVFPIGACTKGMEGTQMTQIGEMQRFGAIAFSDDGRPIENARVFRRVLEYAAMFKAPVISHSEDLNLSYGGSMNEGTVSARLGLPGIPRSAESSAVARDIELSYNFGPLHIAHISTADSVDLIREAKIEGVAVTCETAPHYLVLTDEAIEGYNTNAKMNPPLRTEQDRQILLAALNDGTIDIIATDHAPHTLDDKRVEFNKAAYGIVGLETAVPLIYDKLVKTKIITIERMVELMSSRPAAIFNIADRGILQEGFCADITVIDPTLTKKVDKKEFLSKGRNTPFDGWLLSGWPVLTIVGGKIKHQLI